MTFLKLQSLMTVAREIGAAISGKGWRESFARGDDVSGIGGDRGGCARPAKHSTWVFACLQIINGNIRGIPLKFETLNKKGEKQPFVDAETAAFWARPAETVSGPLTFGAFIELSLNWINLTGQAFWILDDTWLTPRGIKSPIMVARADRMNPIMRGDALLGWIFIDGLGKRYNLLPQQVVRPRFLNPYNDAEGLSPLDAARIAVDADYAAGVFARNVAMSNGDQGVYIIAKGGGALSDEQRNQIVAQLRQKAAMSRRGDYRPAFLTADVAVEDPKIKVVDEAFNNGRTASRNEIYNAFGVPASMAEVTASYSIGSASDRYRLIEQTCVPHGNRLCEAIAEIERLRSGRILSAELDWSQHPVMAAVRMERSKAAAELWKTGVPWCVLNQTHDLGMPEFPGSEDAWLPMNLERVEESTNKKDEKQTTQQEEADEQGDQGDAQKALATSSRALQDLRLLIAQSKSAPLPLNAPKAIARHQGCGCGAHVKGEDSAEDQDHTPDPVRLKLWQAHMKARAPSEKLFASKVRKCLMAARAETLAKLDATDKALAGIRQRGVLDLVFDLSNFTAALRQQTTIAHKDTLEQSLMQFAQEIGADDPWKMESDTTLNFINTRENRIRDCSREIHDQIKDELQTGLAEGETNKQLADRVRSAFNGISKDHAELIAATEVAAAYGYARHDAMSGLGIAKKEWLSAQDGRVRDTHMLADGQTVPMDEPFIVAMKEGGEEPLMHPGDSNGSAENVIRCRCVAIAKK